MTDYQKKKAPIKFVLTNEATWQWQQQQQNSDQVSFFKNGCISA